MRSLTVNTQKSGVTCFNSNSKSLPPLYFDGVLLPYTDSFKYLGMVCEKQINLNTAADAALCPHGRHVQSLFRNTTSLHAYIWLLKTYAIPAGTYVCGSTPPFVNEGTPLF